MMCPYTLYTKAVKNILFEILNSFGKRVFFTEYKECIPPKQQIENMSKAGYKFKIDGKNATKKKVLELL